MSDTTPTPTTATVARTTTSKDSHWYTWAGEPRHSVIGKTTGKPRPVTLGDAKKDNLVPSVTTVLKLLDRPNLNRWKEEQACLAVLTASRLKVKRLNEAGVEVEVEESVDEFVYRVLHKEEQQHEEAQIARDKGTEIHKAFENYFTGQGQLIPPDLMKWIQPAVDALLAYGQSATAEMILVGDGYAGRTDLVLDCEACWRLIDIKSTKKLPDPTKGGAWPEHRLQLAAYGRAYVDRLLAAKANTKPLLVGNIYVSSVNPGEFVICEHEDWEGTYENGFKPLIRHWQWANNYTPVNPVKPRFEPQVAPSAPALSVAVPKPATAVSMTALPETIKGKKVVWSTGVAAPATPRRK